MKEPLDVAMDTAGIARVTINRPKSANAIDPPLAASILEALEWLANDPKLRVLVLLGNGRTFCAGLDLKAMMETMAGSFEANYEDALKLAKLLHRLHTMPTSTGYEVRTEPTYDWNGRRRGQTPFTVLQHTVAGIGHLQYERRRYRMKPGDTMREVEAENGVARLQD